MEQNRSQLQQEVGSELSLEKTAEPIKRWLLRSSIQVKEGEHRGGVAGWLDGRNRPLFVYPEITGYYLTTLAFMASWQESTRDLVTGAQRALEWIERSWSPVHAVPTRSYLGAGKEDWRNRALFSFDLAMILRGLVTAADLLPPADCFRTAALVAEKLADFVDPDGRLLSHIPLEVGVQVIPVRWSTTAGPYQVKTAVAVLSIDSSLIPTRARLAAEMTLQKWQHHFDSRFFPYELHPLFYYLEGMILWGALRPETGALEVAARVYRQVMRAEIVQVNVSDRLRNCSLGGRSDVVAQAFRLGCILRNMGYLNDSGWDERIDAMAYQLKGLVNHHGAVSFYPTDFGPHLHWNSWSAMFGYQAYCFYECLKRKRRIKRQWLRLLI
jgi:hypothetical protein